MACFSPIVCYQLCVTLRSNMVVHRLFGFHARGFLQSETCMNQGECWTWSAFVFIIYYLQVFYSALFYILKCFGLYLLETSKLSYNIQRTVLHSMTWT